MLDRQLMWIALSIRDDLGRWLLRKTRAAFQKRAQALTSVAQSGYSVDTLRGLWETQRNAQLKGFQAHSELCRCCIYYSDGAFSDRS